VPQYLEYVQDRFRHKMFTITRIAFDIRSIREENHQIIKIKQVRNNERAEYRIVRKYDFVCALVHKEPGGKI
jgi:hypothetical protein